MDNNQKDLGPVKVERKTGLETFHNNGKSQAITLNDFWSWSTSDLVLNITRGVLAEFIVAKALDAVAGVRIAWDAFDITTQEPERIKVEVKSAAYLQSWEQNKYSAIQFNVEKTTPPNEDKGSYGGDPRRAADVYVFAVLTEKNKSKVDPMNLDQWEFYVVPTQALEKRPRSQHSITLNSLINEQTDLKMEKADFSSLKEVVKRAAVVNKNL
jgi:hypothetical protein